ARRLAERGVEQRLICRDPSRAPEVDLASTARAEYADGEAMRAALDGVDTLYFVSGSEAHDRVSQHATAVDAAVAAGVERIGYVSFSAAAPDSTFTFARDHFHTEQHIRSTGLRYTFLRDNLYLDFIPYYASDGAIRGPASGGLLSAVARDDIADATVPVLLN